MKHIIRKEILKKLGSQSHDDRRAKSGFIKDKLFCERAFKEARCVMLYVSTDEEVDTRDIINDALEMGKKVCVPLVRKDPKEIVACEITGSDTLRKGPHGIYQPAESSMRRVPLEDIDLVVVPGVAFDAESVRLGRGHGYYDRFLSDLPRTTRTIGLAFDFQVVEKLPRDSHDVPVEKIITA